MKEFGNVTVGTITSNDKVYLTTDLCFRRNDHNGAFHDNDRQIRQAAIYVEQEIQTLLEAGFEIVKQSFITIYLANSYDENSDNNGVSPYSEYEQSLDCQAILIKKAVKDTIKKDKPAKTAAKTGERAALQAAVLAHPLNKAKVEKRSVKNLRIMLEKLNSK